MGRELRPDGEQATGRREMGRAGRVSMGTQVSTKEHWWFDCAYFQMAREQVRLYEEAEAGLDAHMVPLVQTTYAASSLVMLVSAMEAHANYLLIKRLPGKTGLSASQCVALARRVEFIEKWLFLCEMLTGQQLLDTGSAPFQALHRAVRLRNDFVAHPKLLEIVTTDATGVVEPSIQSARSAIEAARGVLQIVYQGMGETVPDWATAAEIGTLSPRKDIYLYLGDSVSVT
jgi:hypothetical protein